MAEKRQINSDIQRDFFTWNRLIREARENFIPLIILILNVIIVYPLFTGEYTQYIGSIEASFISHAKFIVENFPNLNWNPIWYCGFPFHLSYLPLLLYTMGLIHVIFPSIAIASSYRIVAAFMYALGPVTLYLFVKYLTKRELTASLAALVYSLTPSFCYVIIPSLIAVGSSYAYAPWRLIVLMVYGEGPHISGLTIIPIAALAFLHTLRRPEFKNYILTAIAIATVALTNQLALYSLLFILIVILLSEYVLAEVGKKLKTAVYCALMSYGLVAFQYDTSFIYASSAFGAPRVGAILPWFGLLILLIVLATPPVIFLGYCSKKPKLQPWSLCMLWIYVFSIVVFLWHFFLIAFAPQPNRYIPELDMGMAILFGLIITAVYDKLKNGCVLSALGRVSHVLPKATFVVLLLIILTTASLPFLQLSWVITKPNLNMAETPEYEMARWLSAHVENERIYATGTICFWLNVFSNVPQLRGGTDNPANPWWAHVAYQINTGSNGTLAVLWCKALNIKYIVVNYPNASTPYIDYQYPHKFEELLPIRYFYKGFGIFEVPLKHPELVQLVNIRAVQKLNSISWVLDAQNLSAYVNFIEKSTVNVQFSYRIESADKIIINLQNMTDGIGILVKMTYNERWKACCNKNLLEITPVGPYFMLINPNKGGAYEVLLICEKATSEMVGFAITIATLSLCITYITYPSVFLRLKRRRQSNNR